MIEEIIIKFGTELKPTQYSWKSQLYTQDPFLRTTKGENKKKKKKKHKQNQGKLHQSDKQDICNLENLRDA